MAVRSAGQDAWRDSQLCQFYLDEVTATGNTLGMGSYGAVIEVNLTI